MEPGFIAEEHIKHKHPHLRGDKAIDKTQLFSVNQLALTRVEWKFFMGKLRNKVYGMRMYVKVLPASPVIMMMWGDIL